MNYSVDKRWFSGNCWIQTFHLEELFGTKLRALYQRKKGRDLYDLYKALTVTNVNIDKVIACYKKYINFVVTKPPTRKQFLRNMELRKQQYEARVRQKKEGHIDNVRREVDELLDKINRVGYDGLTPAEQKRLKRASEILREKGN